MLPASLSKLVDEQVTARTQKCFEPRACACTHTPKRARMRSPWQGLAAEFPNATREVQEQLWKKFYDMRDLMPAASAPEGGSFDDFYASYCEAFGSPPQKFGTSVMQGYLVGRVWCRAMRWVEFGVPRCSFVCLYLCAQRPAPRPPSSFQTMQDALSRCT